MNKRRLRLAISAILTAAALAYTAFNYVPAYDAFAEDVRERWFWKARGFDDPEVYRKAYENCMADLRAKWPPNSDSEEQQYADSCSRPGWVIGDQVPSWWKTTVAYIKSLGPEIAYVLGAVILGPWLFAFLIVNVVPAAISGIWRWLGTPDDSARANKVIRSNKVPDASIDDFFSAAGKLLQNATTNELFLAKAFEIISGTSAMIAHAVFYTFDSLQAKSNLLRRVVAVSGNETDKHYIDRIIEAAKKSNNPRNSVAHSLLVFDAPDLKSGMRRVSLKAQQHQSISKASLAALLATSSEAMNEGHAALEEFCSSRGVSPLLDVRYLEPFT